MLAFARRAMHLITRNAGRQIWIRAVYLDANTKWRKDTSFWVVHIARKHILSGKKHAILAALL